MLDKNMLGQAVEPMARLLDGTQVDDAQTAEDL